METRMSKDEPGQKFDYGKQRYDLIPGDSLDQLANVYTYGASKYDDNNWRKGMSWSRCFGAMMRHAWKWWRGETYDDESGCHHLAMAAWYCFSLMNYEKTHSDKDDRVKDLFDPTVEAEDLGFEFEIEDIVLPPGSEPLDEEKLEQIKESAKRLMTFIETQDKKHKEQSFKEIRKSNGQL